MNLRDYQVDACRDVQVAWEKVQATLLVMATGLGKTVTFSELVRRRQHLGRALIVAHREELIYQAAEKIEAITGVEPEIEKGMEWSREHSPVYSTRPVVASIQTLNAQRGNGLRMHRFNPDEFSTVIIDEAHRAVAKTYMAMATFFKRNANLRLLGVTATPMRSDKVALGKLFESVAYKMDARMGIEQGWLVPVSHMPVFVSNLRLSDIARSSKDFTQSQLEEIFAHEEVMHEVERGFLDRVGDDKAVVFVPGVASAELLVEIVNRRKPGAARVVTGTTPRLERRGLFQDFRDSKFNVLVNVGVLTEGWDEPELRYVVLARPTKSKGLFMQMVGRGTRSLDGVVDGLATAEERRAAIAKSAKPRCTVIDVTGDPGEHKLVTPVDMLGGKLDDDVREIAEKLLEDADEPKDVDEAIEEAEEMVEQQKELNRQRKQEIIAEADVNWCDLNLFDVADLVAMRERGVYCDPAHVEYLEDKGVPVRGMSGEQITEKYKAVKKWIDGGGCSPKQAKFLRKYGYDTTHMSAKEAQVLFLQIKDNGWRRPR